MLHHLSVSAANPRHVAQVFAELMQGQSFEFPVVSGAYIAVAGDAFGTAIEVLPHKAVWVPGDLEAEGRIVETRPQFAAVHAALSVPVSRETVEEIGKREGWLVRYCDRGPFQLMELWLENTLMVELLTQEMIPNYLEFLQPHVYEAFLKDAMASDNAISRQEQAQKEAELVAL
ncbi:MAG TPA: hypothetical protein IGS53_14600 [Leptolyngbyaceae cyanobacterium M33_DOE_097]|nr:hypothetical protein [Leptolyngbyaceae cyanobacterium M33_DOE_097]